MADANQTNAGSAPKGKRKPQGPRQEKPTFAVISVNDAGGNPIALTPEQVNVRFTKDPIELVKLLTASDRDTNAVVVQASLSGAARPSPASTSGSEPVQG